eukprot:g7651.t1
MSAELVILGGGIMGLWAAVKAARLGLDTLLVESERLGQGASGGLLGALMPHMPDRWNDKKQFQFEALVSLEAEVARLEIETGLSCGYRRSGRLIPLPKEHLRGIALRHRDDGAVNWNQGTHRFHWDVLEQPVQTGWPALDFARAGLVHDTLAARVSPRRLTAALAAFLKAAPGVRVVEHCQAVHVDPRTARITLADGGSIAFGRCVVAAGHQSFALLQALCRQGLQRPIGHPVKGQAALLKAELDPELPLIYLDGIYAVAHENGLVAIGSTSEDRFEHPDTTDAQLDDLLSRVRELAPALRDAPVIERWAGLRPKAIGRDPMIGPHPDHPSVLALTGGFKVSFGLAHKLADAVLAGVTGDELAIPDISFHTAIPRRSGFHAPLKAPFRLASGISESMLLRHLMRFAGAHVPFTLPRLEVARLGNFFGLAPQSPCEHMRLFACAVVQEFDAFRAPLSEAEIERADPGDLSAPQFANLYRWGSPYVMDEFRFHMPLTGPILPKDVERFGAVLRAYFEPYLVKPVEVANLALFVEEEPGAPFLVHSLHPLGRVAARKSA